MYIHYFKPMLEALDGNFERGKTYFKQLDKGNRIGFTITSDGKYDGYVKIGVQTIKLTGHKSVEAFQQAAKVEFNRRNIIPGGMNADYKLEMK